MDAALYKYISFFMEWGWYPKKGASCMTAVTMIKKTKRGPDRDLLDS